MSSVSEPQWRPGTQTGAEFDPGLTQKYTGVLSRVINRDGQFNVKRAGRNWRDANPYIFMISIPWPLFALIVTLAFVGVNLFFAWAYSSLGVEHIKGAKSSHPLVQFWNLFFFSAHTLTTVGYGNMYPDGPAANAIASTEALLGLMTFAIATGLLFGRFSRPSARFGFSDRMVVAPYQERTGLEVRIVNRRSNNLVELEARMMLMTVEYCNGRPQRKYRQLELERAQVLFLALTWTIVHPVDEKSPLFGKTPEELKQEQAEILVLMKAFDETFGQVVYARNSYRYDEIVWGAKFSAAFDVDSKGELLLQVDRVGATEPAVLPEVATS